MHGEDRQGSDDAARATRLVEVLTERPIDHADLFAAVGDYVRGTAAAGRPVTAAIVGLKAALRRAVRDDQADFEALAQRVVTWCIEEYYRDPR